MSKNKIKRMTMRFMVWNMRWMTRYFGFIARPMVRFYASQEIIACGLSDEEGKTFIIYTPSKNVKNYVVHVLRNKWLPKKTAVAPNFSGTVVSCRLVPDAESGDIYKVRAETARGRMLSSPAITNKGNTIYGDDLLNIAPLSNDSVYLSWEKAEEYDPMIYFLVIENSVGDTLSAIYTRENFWTYPLVKQVSLSVGPVPSPKLEAGKTYKTKLLLVDFDGWVSHIDVQTFIHKGG
ncbi:hypothetical protein IIA95_02810 [Patescibacteria group bacterium]|nr:hypothetical protein [Patescibacteria group bacterium]